jgi:ribonuclease H2 subunit A
MDEIMEDQPDSQDILQETPAEDVFSPPSVVNSKILSGDSYTHHSPIPTTIKNDMTTECVLGVDEAGRGPVLGEEDILAHSAHSIDDVRSHGLRTLLLAIRTTPITPSRHTQIR